MLAELVRDRGGAVVASPGDAADAPFLAVLVEDDGLLPALAKLPAGDPDTYLLKEGLVGGPEGRPGCRRVEPEIVARALDAALAGKVEWEQDPDFGYLVAAAIPGVEPPDDGLFLPRFLYARNGRVYEHAEMVPRVREERAALLPAGAGP
jgi:ATP-dependent phosphoenolpyruvate carboxykinase